MYYTQEQDLAMDAKKTELEFARARQITAKLKSAFINGKYPITRMVFLVLCIASLVIPFATLSVSLPLASFDVSLGGIGIYQMIASSLYTQIFTFPSAGIAKDVVIASYVSLALYLLVVLNTAAVFALWLLSFLNFKKTTKGLIYLSLSAIIVDMAFVAAVFILKNHTGNYGFISAELGFGAFVNILLFAVFALINVLFIKYAKPVEISETDLKRIALSKQIKAGEVALQDLPMPIFETDSEKEKRENLLGGGKKKNKQKRGGKDA